MLIIYRKYIYDNNNNILCSNANLGDKRLNIPSFGSLSVKEKVVSSSVAEKNDIRDVGSTADLADFAGFL
jgi:hypothetical protein